MELQKQTELLVIRQEYEQKLPHGELKHTQKMQSAEKEHKDFLAQLLKSAIDKPITLDNNFMTQDHSRRVENVTMTNSNANLGDNVSQNIQIDNLPDGELKTLLQQLSYLIDEAPLSKKDRQQVEDQLTQLTTLSAQPATPETKNEIGKTLGLLKDLSAIFKERPGVGTQFGTLMAKLVLLF